MALIEIHADMKFVGEQLKRIADALERAVPIKKKDVTPNYIGPERVSRVTNDKLWEQQQNAQGEMVEQQGQEAQADSSASRQP